MIVSPAMHAAQRERLAWNTASDKIYAIRERTQVDRSSIAMTDLIWSPPGRYTSVFL
jgi:hypothetical protein